MPIPDFKPSVKAYKFGDERAPEALLYLGSRCDRACSFCTVEGSPKGNVWGYPKEALEAALRLTGAEGRIKVYGGEPALFPKETIEAIAELRKMGFGGRITVFSNGVEAESLIAILESDEKCDGYLNYSIYHGRGAKRLPAASQERLEGYAEAHPGKLFVGHAFLLPAGRKKARLREDEIQGCARCFPTVRGDGFVHACAFVAHLSAARYHLGDATEKPSVILDRRSDFLRWIDGEVKEAAFREGRHFCEVCVERAQAQG